MPDTLAARVAIPRRDVTVDVELAVPAGSTLALVGPSGAGKRTRVMAVLRELYGSGVNRAHLDYKNVETPSGF